MATTTVAEDFLLKEYDALRKEIDACLEEQRQLERYALVACAGIYTWIATNNKFAIALCIPPLLTVMMATRAMALWMQFGQMGAYIRMVEATLLTSTKARGWETFLERT